MKTIQSFKDLTVWQKSIELTEKIYNLSIILPPSEKFGLSSQIQRSAVSISSNIAEGYSRNNRKEFAHFTGMARGSGAELETQLIIAQRVHGLDVSEEIELLTEIRKMPTSLNQKLRE